MKKTICIAILSAVLCTVTGCVFEEVTETDPTISTETTKPAETASADETAPAASYQQITQEEAKKLMESEENCIILDVRRQDEFDAGHIPGAILIPNESITDKHPAELPDPDQMILIYCRSGRRSKEAAEKLANMGYSHIYEFGGIITWDGETVTGTEETSAVSAAGCDTGWKSAYRTVLKNYHDTAEDDGDEIAEIRWDLQDLDSDGTPELLVSEGLFHVAGVLFYAYKDGEAQQVMAEDGEPLRYGVYGEALICTDEQLLGVSNMHMGYNYSAMHHYENGKLDPILSFMEDSGAVGVENVTYTVNDEETTKEKYDAALSEYTSKDWIVAGRQYALDDLSALND